MAYITELNFSPDLAQSTSPLTTNLLHNDVQQSPLKRKSFPNAWEESEEKRQRIGPLEVAGMVENDDFLKNLLAEASAAATESYQKGTVNDNIVHIKSELAMTDGNAYSGSNEFMRRESLPILNSVVS